MHRRQPARLLTVCVWSVTLACVGALGALAGLFVLMATSLDPLQIINAGAEPWIDAAEWSAAFVVESLVAAIGLFAWHRRRLRPFAVGLLVGQVGFVAWAFMRVYLDYT